MLEPTLDLCDRFEPMLPVTVLVIIQFIQSVLDVALIPKAP